MTFLIRPGVLPGESLSSWRQRSGLANGFRWFPSLNNRLPARDPDLLPSCEEVDWLGQQFRIAPESLYSASINQYGETLSVGSFAASFTRWVLPCARESSANAATNGYCPMCLNEDEQPYFRIAWRLAFVTHCPKHKCVLFDRCPNCSSVIWPNSFAERANFPQKSADPASCLGCGFVLSRANPIWDRRHQSSIALWGALVEGKLPADSPPNVSPKDYFSVLWTIGRFIRKKFPALHEGLPSLKALKLAPEAIPKTVLERLPRPIRQTILDDAIWLLGNWPIRLREICRIARLSGSDIGCTETENPQWFNDTIRESLYLHKNWISRDTVASAITELNAQQLPVSKNALRRKLGIAESWAINELLDQRRTAKVAELVTLCRNYQFQLRHTPSSRDQQRTLTRDFLILLLSAFSGSKIEAVCRMEQAEIDRLLTTSRASMATNSNEEGLFLLNFLLELDDQYRTGIRPEFQSRSQVSICTWFISRFGKEMDGHSVRARISEQMKRLLDSRLWCSADAFQKTLFSLTTAISSNAPNGHGNEVDTQLPS